MDATEGPSGPQPGRAGPPLAEALVIGSVVLIAVVAGLSWALSRRAGTGGREPAGAVESSYLDYVGDRACRRCHPDEAALHRRSGHAKTLRPAAGIDLARRLDGREAEDPERPGVDWRFDLRGGRLTIGRTEAGEVERFLVDYAFGSGRHATTFLTLTDRDPSRPVAFEHRLTYFAHSDSLGLTPGQSLAGHASGNSPRGRVHSAEDTLRCFGCHATATSDRGPDALDEATMIPNVSCERCHGPGRAHVEAARRGTVGDDPRVRFALGVGTADEEVRSCGGCHRLPEMVRPGSIRVENAALVRHQPVGLLQSACYARSEGALRCVTCHDPHARASTDRASYERACLSCHEGPSRAACPVSPRTGCLECHMPRRDVARGMLMTDHWIRIIPDAGTRRDPMPDESADPSG